MSFLHKSLTNGNLWIDGNNFVGRVEELTLPELKGKTAQSSPLGMIGTIENISGYEQLEGRMLVNAPYADLIALVAGGYTSHQFAVYGNNETHNAAGRAAQEGYAFIFTGKVKSTTMGEFKAHERVTMEFMISVDTMKLEMNNRVVIEYDVFAPKYEINGVDQLAIYRRNLGL